MGISAVRKIKGQYLLKAYTKYRIKKNRKKITFLYKNTKNTARYKYSFMYVPSKKKHIFIF